ncbi:tryptophan synthase subunit alpha [Naumannella huperziae]
MIAFDPGRTGTLMRRLAAEQDRSAFVGYWPVGFPDLPASLEYLRALCGQRDEPGADLVEIGIPYSDPMIDGSTVQRATTQALANGVRTRDVFAAAETVAAAGRAPVVMTYWNLIEQYGVDAFARDLAAAGGQGVITPDLTPDEAAPWLEASEAHGLDRIFLLAPSSTPERIAATLRACRGWVYATAVMGVTGARAQVSQAAPLLVQRIRESAPDALVGVGLGVSTGEQAAAVVEYADAAIVGSALIQRAFDVDVADGLSAVRELASEFARGVGCRPRTSPPGVASTAATAAPERGNR